LAGVVVFICNRASVRLLAHCRVPPPHRDILLNTMAFLCPKIGVAVLFVLSVCPPVGPQTPEPQAADPVATLRTQTRLVQIDVVVKDSRGRAVDDLSKQDFTVTDRGRPRAIQIFSKDGASPAEHHEPPVRRTANLFSNRIPAIAEPGRVTALVLDGNNTTFDDFAYARKQIIDLAGKLASGDRMAIYVLYLGLRVVQDYTSDRDLLLKSITAYRPPPLTPRPGMGRTAPRLSTRGGSPFEDVSDGLTAGMSPAETAFFVRRRAEDTMAAFRAISSHMSMLPGRKSVIWVTGGFSWRQLIDSKASFQATTAAMNDANVALYPVDARLLMNGTQSSIATMQQFAEATGGKAYYLRNDLDNAIQEAIEDARVTYTLGFYLADDERDGEFHPLKVSVDRHGLELRYRQGYYAETDSRHVTEAKKAELEAELLNPLDSTAVGIDARVDVVKDGAERKLQIHMNLDPRTLTLKPSGNAWSGKIDQLFVERAQDGKVLAKVSNSGQFEVSEKTRARYDAGAMAIATSIRLMEGAVNLHIIVRDAATGRIGSLTVPLKSLSPTDAW
jgi:VWFA-related protein